MSSAESADPLGGGEGEQHPKAFARSVSSPNIVYAGIDTGGTLISTDGGITWAKNLDDGAYGKGYQSIGVDPNDPNVLYAHSEITSGNGAEMRDALEPYEGLYRSDDWGTTWTQVLSLPNPTSEEHGNYRIWRSMMTPVSSQKTATKNQTAWYVCYDRSGIWRIFDNKNTSTLPNPQLKAAEPETDIYYWVTHYKASGKTYLLYGTEDGLFRREILPDGGLSPGQNMNLPVQVSPSDPREMAGVNYVHVNPANPNEIWALRRWDRPYRTLNGNSASPTWEEVTPIKPDGQALSWNDESWAMDGVIMAITPFSGGGHMTTVTDGSVQRTVPNRGFLSTAANAYRLVWVGGRPHWERYRATQQYNLDFAKRPSLSSAHLRAPLGAHAGFVFNPNNADDVAAFGSATFWKTDLGGLPQASFATWRHTGYGFTGYCVQIGIGGVHVLDANPGEKWFPWNDVGIGVTRDDAASFARLPDIPAQKNQPPVDVFYWKTSGNVAVNPDNPLEAVAHMGWYIGNQIKVGHTKDGGASWQVASTDPAHFLPTAQIGGGVYVRLRNTSQVWKTRPFMGPLHATDDTNHTWAKLNPFSDQRGGDYETPRSNRLYSVIGASAGDGRISPDEPTLYAGWTAGWSQILRGEPNWSKASRYDWWSVLDDPSLSFKHTAGFPLLAVSPKNRNIVFGAVSATGAESYVGTPFGQCIVRLNFTGAKNADSPLYDKTGNFLPAQPGPAKYNIINDLAADPRDDRTVYAVSAAPGLPFVFKIRFNWNGTITVTDLTDDLPRIGATSVTFDPSGGGRLLVSGLAGTWGLEL